jgi:hypothetical protein
VAALALLLHGDDYAHATVSAATPAAPDDFAPGELLVKAQPWVPAAMAAAAAESARLLESIPDLDVLRIKLPAGPEVAEAVDAYERLS